MARGIIYHITVDPTCINDMSASDFEGYEETMSVEYFEDRPDADAQRDIERLVAELRKHFNIMESNGVYTIVTGNKFTNKVQKTAYFQPMLKELRQKVNSMTTVDFIEPLNPYDLTKLIDDNYSDAVYLDMGTGPATYTLHSFIRRLQPDMTYHIGTTTILMH